MIQVSGLVKQFGPFLALRGLDFSVAAGEFVSLLGPNGAGKTTLLRILATLSRPTHGTVSIAGHTLPRGADDVRRQIGFLSHQPLLYGELTAEENLRFFAKMYNLDESGPRIDALLDQVDLAERRRDRVRTFSRGMQQRLAIARALLHDPRVVLLDEPFTGLDPDASDQLSATLRGLQDGRRAVVMTTHDLDRGLALSDRALVIARGRLAHEARRDEIQASNFRETYSRVTRQR
ncbi:MAG TPA: heme ABC exporter ATP-binding protein CcmA [Anaerolineae bacterium]|nr:heme ABC exporter ATP-binding protein CcmA [Anaerolineae bacterium]